ncbi:GM17105 [Drosophila sechellia]|uniref:GM17105 n=1 Tax=Drosophila sechellia TaxID=7238 RepID=B4I5E0_DROSE|nr:GM17105 [Drosophila sechellia]
MEQAGLPMGNSGVSQQIHNTGPIPVLGPSGVSSYLRSCSPGRVPKENYGDSVSSIDRNPYMFRRSMEYPSDTESSETSSSSDSNMSSNEPSTSMGYT